MGWTEHDRTHREVRNAYKILVEKLGRKKEIVIETKTLMR
jgi:hypothetical protein